MKINLDKITASKTVEAACNALQEELNNLRSHGYLGSISDYYEKIEASSPDEVLHWHDEMKDDEGVNEAGHLKELYRLFGTTLKTLRKLGFESESD